MTLLEINLTDVLSETDPDDRVVVWAPAFREGPAGQLVGPRRKSIPLVDGVGSDEVVPGPLMVQVQCKGIADTRPREVVVPEEGPVTLTDLLHETFTYTPAVVNRALDDIEGARDEALGQVDGAVAAEVDAIKWDRGFSEIDADTLFTPGSYNIRNSNSTGLPFYGIANLQVLPIVSGAAQIVYDWNGHQVWHRRSQGGVYGTWRRIANVSDVPTIEDIVAQVLTEGAGSWLRSVPLAVTTGGGGAQGAGTGHYRIRTEFAAPITRWRLHISTRYPIYPTVRGGITLHTVGVGGNAGGGQISDSTSLLTADQVVAAGDEWVSDWTRHDLTQDSLIDVDFTADGETYNLLAPAWVEQADGTWVQVNRAPLWVWIEAETYTNTPTVALIGDSTGAGHGSIEPVWDSALHIAAREQGFLPVLFSHSGDTLSGNSELDDLNFARWSDYGPYDSVVIQAGSNDLNGGATLAEMQDRFTKVAAVAQQLAPVVVGATIKPRYPTDTVGEVRIPYNEWLLSRPDGVWTTLDYSGAVAPDGTVAAEDNDDGPHLKKSGHEKMATAYAPVRIARPRLAGDPGEDAAPQVTVDTTVGTRIFAGDTMIYGDTGWRDVVPLSTVPATTSGGWARIRRSGNTVELSLSSMKFETTGNVTLMTFPVGFRPSNHTPFVTVKYWTSDTAEVGRVNMNGALEMRGLTAENTLSSAVIYTTSDPWPASLPGAPA